VPNNGVHDGYNNSNNHRSSDSSDGGQSRPRCQVCLKVGHTATRCWYKFDEDYVTDDRLATMASASSIADSNWYLDSGATDHITSELEKLTAHEAYNGHDQLRTVNGAGMDIIHVGKTILPTPTRPLHLHNVLHVPNTQKQLMSIHRFIMTTTLLLSCILCFS
jgi:hypothetical protein